MLREGIAGGEASVGGGGEGGGSVGGGVSSLCVQMPFSRFHADAECQSVHTIFHTKLISHPKLITDIELIIHTHHYAARIPNFTLPTYMSSHHSAPRLIALSMLQRSLLTFAVQLSLQSDSRMLAPRARIEFKLGQEEDLLVEGEACEVAGCEPTGTRGLQRYGRMVGWWHSEMVEWRDNKMLGC